MTTTDRPEERLQLLIDACHGLQNDRLRAFIDQGGIGKVMEKLAHPEPTEPQDRHRAIAAERCRAAARSVRDRAIGICPAIAVDKAFSVDAIAYILARHDAERDAAWDEFNQGQADVLSRRPRRSPSSVPYARGWESIELPERIAEREAEVAGLRSELDEIKRETVSDERLAKIINCPQFIANAIPIEAVRETAMDLAHDLQAARASIAELEGENERLFKIVDCIELKPALTPQEPKP